MFIPSQQQNLENMRKCPRFDSCNVPLCPLDFWMNERVELPEDEKCILITQKRGKLSKGLVRGSLMKKVGKYIWAHNRRGNIRYPESIVSGMNGGVGKVSEKIRAENKVLAK